VVSLPHQPIKYNKIILTQKNKKKKNKNKKKTKYEMAASDPAQESFLQCLSTRRGCHCFWL
jgi:hypothetical protein